MKSMMINAGSQETIVCGASESNFADRSRRNLGDDCLLRADANVKKYGLTASHIFGLLHKLEPYADFAAMQPLLATRMPVLDGPVVVDDEIVLGR